MENHDSPQPEELNSLTKKEAQDPPVQDIKKIAPPPYYTPYVPRNTTQAYKDFKTRVMSPKGLITSVLSILLCILFTETILFGSAGVSVVIFVSAFYCTIFYFFREKEMPLNKPAVYLTIPTLLMALSFLIHYNPSTQWITWPTLIGILCIQLILLGNIHVRGIFTLDMVSKVLVNLVGRPLINLGMPFNSFGLLKEKKSKAMKNSIYILIGLAISMPVAAILMNLFMSADAVFADAVNTFVNFIGLDFTKIFWDIVFGLILGTFLAAALLGLKYSEAKQKPSAKIGDFIESIIIGTFLTIINVFIIAFVGFQFVYLFGGSVNITASGMSYAEYARRGFFELSAASGIIFAIALFVLIMTRKKDGRLSLWVRLSTVLLCACDGVMLVSAVKRMLMYVEVYGLSVKRVLTLWFMAIIGLCLLWMIVKCLYGKIDVMQWIGITVITGVCILGLTNTERIIAKYNVDSYLANPAKTSIDVYYLGQLSYTAVPEIVRLKDLKEGSINNTDIRDLLKSQQNELNFMHDLYGFTFDSIEARKILNRELK